MDFKNVQLKKVVVAEKKVTNSVVDEEALYLKQIEETNVESWYPYLADFTMKTWFVELTPELAKIFQKQFLHLEKNGPPLSLIDQQQLISLETRLDLLISENPSTGVFVRCSTRSPKDSQVSRARCRDILKSELTPDSTANQKLAALLKAALGGMKSKNGSEAIRLLTTSERIYEDFSAGLENPSKFRQLIILREWKDIPISNEYRGFVCNKNLNAVTQYYHTIFFEHLSAVWEANIQRIRDYFETKLKSVIPLDSYIIDFALLVDGSIIVIELNPFSIATDSNLFSWKDDIDILKNGPFTSRMTDAPLPTTKGVDMAIEELLNEGGAA